MKWRKDYSCMKVIKLMDDHSTDAASLLIRSQTEQVQKLNAIRQCARLLREREVGRAMREQHASQCDGHYHPSSPWRLTLIYRQCDVELVPRMIFLASKYVYTSLRHSSIPHVVEY